MNRKLIALAATAAIVLSVGSFVAGSAIAGTPATPLTVGLTGGGSMTSPSVAGGVISFDLTVPALTDGQYVTPIGWTAPGLYWELVVELGSVYVQWERDSTNGLNASQRPLAVGLHHVRVDTAAAKVFVDDEVLVTIAAAGSGPVSNVVVNPLSH